MTEQEEDGISRRDFLEGALIAAGGMAVLGSSPMRALASLTPTPTWPCDTSIGTDPRVIRGGNLRATFDIAHLMRDNRLTWSKGAVTVAPGSCDTLSGKKTVVADTGTYDLIVVGGGISGLATAFFTLKNKPNAKILILEGNPRVGGNASRDDASPALPTQASSAAAYFVYPYDTFLFDFYGGCGVEYAQNIITGSFYNYYFDSAMPATSKTFWNGPANGAPTRSRTRASTTSPSRSSAARCSTTRSRTSATGTTRTGLRPTRRTTPTRSTTTSPGSRSATT
jgi:hypothetical protein